MLPLALATKSGRLAEDVTAAAVTPEVVGHQAESLDYFHVQIQETAPALFSVIGGGDGSDGWGATGGSDGSDAGIIDFEVPLHSPDFEVNPLDRIKCQFRNDIGSNVGSGYATGACAKVQFARIAVWR